MHTLDHRRGSFAWTAAAWVAVIAILAGAGLFVLQRWHNQAAHQLAAQSVAERGQWLAMNLALRAAAAVEAAEAAGVEGDAGPWREFSGQLRSLREVEGDLEFVAVRRGGLTLFQEHADEAAAGEEAADYAFTGPVVLGRQRLSGGAGQIPVLTFSVEVSNPRSGAVALELGLRRGAVAREEWAATRAIDSMYRLSLMTMGICFAVCLALVAGMARREEHRERARRREEHLAFSGMLANGIVHDFRNPMSSLRLDAQMLEKEVVRGPDLRPERNGGAGGKDAAHAGSHGEGVPGIPGAGASRRGAAGASRSGRLRPGMPGLLAPRFEAAGVTPVLDSPAGEVPVHVSEAAVKRALLNVLLNALQHAGPAGRVAVAVLARAGDRARVDVAIRVRAFPGRNANGSSRCSTPRVRKARAWGCFWPGRRSRKTAARWSWPSPTGPAPCCAWNSPGVTRRRHESGAHLDRGRRRRPRPVAAGGDWRPGLRGGSRGHGPGRDGRLPWPGARTWC
jgi:signal transduction histidine kinase